MADYYKLVVPEERRHTDWTTGVVLERDDDGNVTKEVGSVVPAELNADDVKKVEALGYTLEKSSKKEAEIAQASGAGADVAAAGPVFGNTTDQASDDAKK